MSLTRKTISISRKKRKKKKKKNEKFCTVTMPPLKYKLGSLKSDAIWARTWKLKRVRSSPIGLLCLLSCHPCTKFRQCSGNCWLCICFQSSKLLAVWKGLTRCRTGVLRNLLPHFLKGSSFPPDGLFSAIFSLHSYMKDLTFHLITGSLWARPVWATVHILKQSWKYSYNPTAQS